MLTYAHVCWRMLAYAGVCWRILTCEIGIDSPRGSFRSPEHVARRSRSTRPIILLYMCPHTTIYASSYYYLISTSNTTQLSPEHGAGAPQDRQESPEHVVEAAAGTDFTCLTGTKVRLLTQLLQMWGWEVVEERRKTRAVGQMLGVRLWRPRR